MEYNSLMQIYSATFLPNIIKIGQHLTYCENQKGELFGNTVYVRLYRTVLFES